MSYRAVLVCLLLGCESPVALQEQVTKPPSKPVPTAAPKTKGPAKALRAFLVLQKDVEVGVLGEGPGPFISQVRSAMPNPWLEQARFTSRNRSLENPISHILVDKKSFDGVVDELKTRGYLLREVSYEQVFAPPDQSALGGPESPPSGPEDF